MLETGLRAWTGSTSLGAFDEFPIPPAVVWFHILDSTRSARRELPPREDISAEESYAVRPANTIRLCTYTVPVLLTRRKARMKYELIILAGFHINGTPATWGQSTAGRIPKAY